MEQSQPRSSRPPTPSYPLPLSHWTRFQLWYSAVDAGNPIKARNCTEYLTSVQHIIYALVRLVLGGCLRRLWANNSGQQPTANSLRFMQLHKPRVDHCSLLLLYLFFDLQSPRCQYFGQPWMHAGNLSNGCLAVVAQLYLSAQLFI